MLTDRPQNYLLLHQVKQLAYNFREDIAQLWVIQKIMIDGTQSQQQGVAWFELFKKAVAFRIAHETKLGVIFAKLSSLNLAPFQWCFILEAANEFNAVQITYNYAESMPSIPPTTDLLVAAEIAKAQVDLAEENKQTHRKFQTFDRSAEQIAVDSNAVYERIYCRSKRGLCRIWIQSSVPKKSWDIFIRDIVQHPEQYAQSAPDDVLDFLRRYHKQDDTNLAWAALSDVVTSDEQLSMHVNQVLYQMRTFENDGKLDQIVYDVINERWEKH